MYYNHSKFLSAQVTEAGLVSVWDDWWRILQAAVHTGDIVLRAGALLP